jgi:hypothetical protein
MGGLLYIASARNNLSDLVFCSPIPLLAFTARTIDTDNQYYAGRIRHFILFQDKYLI